MNAEFSLPASTVAELGSRFTNLVDAHSRTCLVTASSPDKLAVAIPVGPGWLEISRPAQVVAPGAFALAGLLSPGARHLDGVLSYELLDDRLLMRSDLGATGSEPVHPAKTANYVHGPETLLGTVGADLLVRLLRVLPLSLGKELHFFTGGAFVGNHLVHCCARHEALALDWTIPSVLVRLATTLLKEVEGDVQVLIDERGTALAIDGASLHWPTMNHGTAPPTWKGDGCVLGLRQAKLLGKAATSEDKGTIRLELLAGYLQAEVRTAQGKVKETLRIPCPAHELPSMSVACHQVATVLARAKSDELELCFNNGQLIVREVQRDLEVTYALPAMRHRA